MTFARLAFRRALVLSALLIGSPVLNVVAQNQQAAREDPLRRTSVYRLPEMDRAIVQTDIPYKTINGATLKLDAYYPPGTRDGARLPVVIFVNGVGDPPPGVLKVKQWGQYTSWPRLVTTMGMAAITYESRSSDAATDSADLIDYVRKNAASLKVDDRRLCLWACSANVRVGLPMAMQAERAYLRCAVFYYGAAQVQSTRDDLPILMVRAGLDSPGLNNGIEAFAREAIAGDVPVTVINYVDGQHAFDLLDDTDESREIIKQTLGFMKFHLTKPEASAARRSLTPARLVAMIHRDGIDKALRALDEVKRTRPDDVLLREFMLNQIGYRLLQDRKTKEAVEIFKLVVVAYGNSANAYDSLADAYEADGNREMAIQFAEKALEKLATDTNIDEPRQAAIRNSASDKLRRLKP